MTDPLLAIEQACSDGLTENNYAACLAAFEEFLAAGCISRLLNAELQEMYDNEAADRQSWNAGQYVIQANERYSLHLATHRRSPTFLYSATSVGMVSPLGTKPVAYDRYRLPDGWCNEIFDPSVRPRLVESAVAKPGEIIQFHSGDIIDLKFDGEACLAKFFSTDFDAVMWSFDRHSLEPLHAYSADMESTIYTYMAEALAEFGGQRAIPGLTCLSTHPVHYVRWKAIQMLGRVCQASTVSALEAASNDPHPHVRNAAQKSLANIRQARECV